MPLPFVQANLVCMRQRAFSDLSFARSVRAGDSSRFGVNLAIERDALMADAREQAFKKLNLDDRTEFSIRDKWYHSHRNYPTTLVLRSLSSYIKRIENVTMPSRDSIVKGVIQTLSDATPFYVSRRDIRSFYESIPLEGLKQRLLYSAALAPNARRTLKEFFDCHCLASTHGLPRGVGLTAVLAEVVMRDYDAAVRALPHVFRYFRFADDILIFYTQPEADFENRLLRCLPDGMAYNPDKREDISVSSMGKDGINKEINYLGYRFQFSDKRVPQDFREVEVSISKHKLNKLKTRAILSLKRFRADGNITLLYRRLRFITGNYKIERKGLGVTSRRRYIRSGIYYNYHLCGFYKLRRIGEAAGDDLKQLDGFLHALLSGGSSEFSLLLSQTQFAPRQSQLRRLSFFQGYRKRLTFRFPPYQVRDIKRAWQNV